MYDRPVRRSNNYTRSRRQVYNNCTSFAPEITDKKKYMEFKKVIVRFIHQIASDDIDY